MSSIGVAHTGDQQSYLGTTLRIYLRMLAVLLIGLGLYRWTIIVGVVPAVEAESFAELPGAWQWATINLAVAYLIAGVGLWMLTSWGLVFWFYAAASEIAMHTIFSGTFGVRLLPIALQLGLLLVYAAFLFAIRRAEADQFQRQRAERQIDPNERPIGTGRFTVAARERLSATLTRRRLDADRRKPTDRVGPS